MSLSLTLREAAEITGGSVVSGDPASRLGRLAIDSRNVRPGDWFLGIPGENSDGNAFAAETLRKGAGGVILSRKQDLPANTNYLLVRDSIEALQQLAENHRRNMPAQIVGITGSNGKTTTKEMLSRVLDGTFGPVLATRGNMNSQIGLPLMLLELESKHRFAVLEMGASQKGNLARLASLTRPRYGIVTNVGLAHVGVFGSPEDVLEAKWELIAALPRDGVAVLNADDPMLARKIAGLAVPKILYGVSPKADVRAENIRQDPQAVFDLTVGGLRQEVRLPLVGLFNVHNALAAASVAMFAGVPFRAIAEALSSFVPPPQRMQNRTLPDGSVFVLDSYNANPSSMDAALRSFVHAYPTRRRFVVLGSMKELGKFSETEHRALGRRLADLPLEGVFFLGEEGRWAKEEFLAQGGRFPFQTCGVADELREGLRAVISSDAAVLFKASRSVRLEQIFEPLMGR